MGYDWREAYIKQFSSIICQKQPIKGGIFANISENYLCRNVHVICNNFGAYPPEAYSLSSSYTLVLRPARNHWKKVKAPIMHYLIIFQVSSSVNIPCYGAAFSKLLKTCYSWDHDIHFEYHKPYELKIEGDTFFMFFSFFAHIFFKENILPLNPKWPTGLERGQILGYLTLRLTFA